MDQSNKAEPVYGVTRMSTLPYLNDSLNPGNDVASKGQAIYDEKYAIWLSLRKKESW